MVPNANDLPATFPAQTLLQTKSPADSADRIEYPISERPRPEGPLLELLERPRQGSALLRKKQVVMVMVVVNCGGEGSRCVPGN